MAIRPIIRPIKGGGSAQGKNIYLKIINLNDIVPGSWPKRDEGGVVMVGDIVLKPGKYIQEIYGTSSTISMPRASEGDEDAMGFTGTPEFSHPGSSLEVEEFIMENTNQPLAVLVEVGGCSTGDTYYKVSGSPCNPLNLMIEGQDNNEGVKDLMKFNQSRKAAELAGRYYGTLTKATANLIDADTVDVDVSPGSGEYKLQDNTAPVDINNVINATDNRVFTLIGSGGANPANIKATNPNFQLKADWIGLSQSRITLKAFKKDDDTFVFFEQSRS